MAIIYTLHVGFADANGDCANALDNRGLLFTALNSVGFDGYTVLDGTGCYNGKHEPGASVVFILQDYGDYNDVIRFHSKVKEAGRLYKELAKQAEVWLTIRDESLEVL